MTPTYCLALTISVLVLMVGFVQAEVLANSGMPMKGANPQRNYNINKKILCPDIAPGRTQVWNIAWHKSPVPKSTSYYLTEESLTIDNEGNLYLQVSDNNVPKIVKINSTNGDALASYTLPFSETITPTHVGNKMYIVGKTHSIIVNTASMTELASLAHDLGANEVGSYAPLGTDFMVSSNQDFDPIDILRYIKTSTRSFDTSQFSFSSVNAEDVIVHNANLPLVVTSVAEESLAVTTPEYETTVAGPYLLNQAPYVQDNTLIVHVADYTTGLAMTTLYFDVITGNLLYNLTTSGWNGTAANAFGAFRVFGDKSIGYMQLKTDGKLLIVDFLKNKILLEDRNIYGQPQYSVPDNSVLFLTKELNLPNGIQEFISLDWDTQMINAIGSFPTDGLYGDIILSPPVVGEECTVYSYYSDFNKYPGELFAFKPLPVSDIVPILDCVNEEGTGYFSYTNKENTHIVIPYASDRNNLSPMNIAPEKTFKANQRGRYFPFSSLVALANTTNTFTWQLEDHVLSFTKNSPSLRCPKNVTIVVYFNATTAPGAEFAEWFAAASSEFMEVVSSRVIVPPTKRNIFANDFEVKLQINYDPILGSAEANVRLFGDPGRILDFNSYLASDSPYTANGITLKGMDGVQLTSEISGTIPPKAAPFGQAPSPTPSPQGPTPTNNTPKSPTSVGVIKHVSGIVALVVAGVLVVL